LFVFLQLQKPDEKVEQIQQAHLSLYEQKGIEMFVNIPNLLKDVSYQPISKEIERIKLPDLKNITEFNSYLVEGRHPKPSSRASKSFSKNSCGVFQCSFRKLSKTLSSTFLTFLSGMNLRYLSGLKTSSFQ